MEKITGLILAGGRGIRMGNIDKGLKLFNGIALVAHAVQRFAPQVDELLINANCHHEEYGAFGHRVIADANADFAGPLAGLLAGMTHARHPLIACVPCDSPLLPADLVSRLLAALQRDHADVAVATTHARSHPVFCLVNTSLAPHLQAYLDSGQRKFEKWYADLKTVEVSFDDDAAAFSNINTIDELAALEQSSTEK
ncbi:MAG: molybdenum cofactor guanylyltransferase MobA [Betaproteobacteria bacterium]